MTPEMLAIIAAAIALGGLILALFQMMNRRMDSLERRVERGFDSLESRFSGLGQQQSGLQQQQASLGERQARLEGLMEAIRDVLLRTPAAQ